MNKLIKIGLIVVPLLGVLLAAAVYMLFHGYFDHGLFEVKQVDWSPSPPQRVAVVAERSDHDAMSSDTYFVLIGDHVFSTKELRRAYHSDNVTFAAAADCLSVKWRDAHHLVVSCREGAVDSAHIDVRKTKTDDVVITYANIADSTAKEYSPARP
jgi:hypothetical protein